VCVSVLESELSATLYTAKSVLNKSKYSEFVEFILKGQHSFLADNESSYKTLIFPGDYGVLAKGRGMAVSTGLVHRAACCIGGRYNPSCIANVY